MSIIKQVKDAKFSFVRRRKIDTNSQIFVISDLHIGDGSKKDVFTRGARQKLLDKFLDHVEAENGKLIIAGDFLELWKFSFDRILSGRRELFDRLAGMDVEYVLGNHDITLERYADRIERPHEFLGSVRKPFYMTINDVQFKFMHGHEADPFIGQKINTIGPVIGRFARMLEINKNFCLVTNDALSDSLLEIGEHLLLLWHSLMRKMNSTVQQFSSMLPNENAAMVQRPLRTIKMINRYLQDKQSSIYDVAIAGHTHKEGVFGGWYYNSGSWTGHKNSFLRIQPDGKIELFDWLNTGKELNVSTIF